MLVSILHEIDLTYSVPTTEFAMAFRVSPRSNSDQTLRNFKIMIAPETPILAYTDWQENRVHQFTISGAHDRVIICAKSTIDVHPRRWRLDELTDSFPIVQLGHRCQDYLLPHGPVQFDPRLEQLAKETGLTNEKSLSKVLKAVMVSSPKLVASEQMAPQNGNKVSEVLTDGPLEAEDNTCVALSLLRLLGIPARYVSGYLFGCWDNEYDNHVWLQAFTPSLGWVGLDPTIGQQTGDSHIAVSIGRSHLDVPQQRVVFRGEASQEISVRIRKQSTQKDCYGELSYGQRINDRQRINLMSRDRALSADSLEQQMME